VSTVAAGTVANADTFAVHGYQGSNCGN